MQSRTPRHVLEHQDGLVRVTDLADGRLRVDVELFAPVDGALLGCDTGFPLALVEATLALEGPAKLCYLLGRHEHAPEVRAMLEHAILGYVDPGELAGARLLDVHCGSGAWTMMLAAMVPAASAVVGADHRPELVRVARLRPVTAGQGPSVAFVDLPGPTELPAGLELFDAVVVTRAFHHLAPRERAELVPRLWSALAPGGILFLNQAPHRFYPVEAHVTGLPLLNYVPDRAALSLARRLSSRVSSDATWEQLLGAGVRGTTAREVLGLVRTAGGRPTLLRPTRLGCADAVDVWYAYSTALRPHPAKRAMRAAFKATSLLLRAPFAPDLNLALRKA